jgi:hypothetical protein
MKKRRMVVDTANLLFRVASAHGKYNAGQGSAEDQAGLAMHIALNTLKSHYNKVKPDQIALTFEGSKNWRKEYTRSEECVSKRIYKANRVKDDSMIPFFELIKAFEQLAREHTSLVCLGNPICEGDDLFGAYIEKYCGEGDDVLGLSGDKDFVQFVKRFPNFTLLNPDKAGASRHLDKKGNEIDGEYFMFEKAFRGDVGDNVMPAYPRVRSTRLAKAYNDPYELTNIMNETWTFDEPETGNERVFRVGDLFEENMLLMSLMHQPEHVRQEMFRTLDHEVQNHGQFNFFAFMKFCGKYKLNKIAEDATSFVEMFSCTGQNTEFKEEVKANIAEKKAKKASSLVF